MSRQRRSIRLAGYDYAAAGAYFVTVCTHEARCLFGEALAGEILLNDAGRMVEQVWSDLPRRFARAALDAFIVMPNHVHGIILIGCTGDPCDRPLSGSDLTTGEYKIRPHGTPTGSLGRIIQAFKSITTHMYARQVHAAQWASFNHRLWQRNYYEHIIRNVDDLRYIRRYILGNPQQWAFDRNNPAFSEKKK